jgi:prepilin-type N-terminal cleavage/methylation domain-containing protein
MRKMAKGCSAKQDCRSRAERGASMLEMLIVVMIICIASTWAFLHIVEAQQSAQLAAQTQQLTAYLDKARLDSIRRRATIVNQMARVSIDSATSYSVTLDANGDGQLDAPGVFRLPPGGISFNVAAFPTVIIFNWRGRIVDADGNQTNSTAAINLMDSHGSGPSINLSTAGDTTTYSNVNIANVNVSGISSTANMRPRTQMPSPASTPTP